VEAFLRELEAALSKLPPEERRAAALAVARLLEGVRGLTGYVRPSVFATMKATTWIFGLYQAGRKVPEVLERVRQLAGKVGPHVAELVASIPAG
jgi:hypothetical protein